MKSQPATAAAAAAPLLRSQSHSQTVGGGHPSSSSSALNTVASSAPTSKCKLPAPSGPNPATPCSLQQQQQQPGASEQNASSMQASAYVQQQNAAAAAASFSSHPCSVLYVFSTALANRAAQSVACRQYSSVLEFHQNQEETRRLLLNTTNFYGNLQLPPSAVAKQGFNGGGGMTEMGGGGDRRPPLDSAANDAVPGASSSSSAASADRSKCKSEAGKTSADGTPSQSELKRKQCSSLALTIKKEALSPAPCNQPSMTAMKDGDSDNTEGTASASSAATDQPPASASSAPPFSRTLDASNLPLSDVPNAAIADDPLEKMAKLTEETLPFEPPLKQAKIGSPREKARFSDDQLTPAQRQHRQEALQRIEDLKSFFGLSSQLQGSLPPGSMTNPPILNPMITTAPVNENKLILAPVPQAAPPGASGAVLTVVPSRIALQSDQHHAEAQMQWQQLVAEHEAKKQMQQNMLPTLTAPLCRSAPSTPVAVDQTASLARPGTKMTVQGKPAMMVPPVAPPRTPQRVRSSRMASAPARSNFIDSKSPVFIPVNNGQPTYPGPNGPYDSVQPPPMNYGPGGGGFPPKQPPPQQQPCPRYMTAMTMGAGGTVCETAGTMNDPAMFQTGPSRQQYGSMVPGMPEPPPPLMDPNAAYGIMTADMGYMDPSFINSPPNPYLQYQQQPQQQPQHNPGPVDPNEYPPGSIQLYNQMNPNGMQHMGPGNPELSGGNISQQPALPMVNNTYVNATMSIQQVNIQNVSPFPPGTGVISVQSGQGPAMNGHQNYGGARFVSPIQKSAGVSSRTAYGKQQRPSFAPSDVAPQNMPTMRQLQGFSNGPSQFSMDLPANSAALNSSGFLSGYAEPLTNLESKVPSQKLQYFPDPAQQPSQFSSGAQYCVSDGGCMPPQIMQCNLIQHQQQPCLESPGFVHGVPPQQAYSVSMQSSDMSGGMKRGGPPQVSRFAAPYLSSAAAATAPNSARDNVYQMQFHNFQQQLYATSVRRNEGNLT